MALKSGQLTGLDVPAKTMRGVDQWLDSVASADQGAYGYVKGAQPTPSMTAVGLLCREYLGRGPRNPGLNAGIKNLQKTPPGTTANIYYHFYATQVVFHFGGDAWKEWKPKMRAWLIEKQDKGTDPKHDHQKGSWSPQGDPCGVAGGRLMATSWSLLLLELHERPLPSLPRIRAAGKK